MKLYIKEEIKYEDDPFFYPEEGETIPQIQIDNTPLYAYLSETPQEQGFPNCEPLEIDEDPTGQTEIWIVYVRVYDILHQNPCPDNWGTLYYYASFDFDKANAFAATMKTRKYKTVTKIPFFQKDPAAV